jgi:uncharacterized membrane protein
MSQAAIGPTVATASSVTTATPPRSRIDALDLLRGVVMVLMALDHVRDFLTEARFDPLDLSRTTAAMFLTRWVTHFCAPVFVFLAGTGAFLSGARGKTRPQLAWFLLTRGLWLVVLEFTLIHLAWFFNFEYTFLLAQVFWAIGWSMVVLSALVFLPTWAITALGVVLIAGHNAVAGVDPTSLGVEPWLWTALLRPGLILLQAQPQRVLFVVYPILPWLGIMLAGYGFGPLWLKPRQGRRKRLIALSVVLLIIFVALRAANVYGDPNPWSPQSTDAFTVLSFLNCTKYPPSLLYVLMTIGPSMLLLAWWDRERGPLGGFFVTFGRVPLFYYLLHVPLIHLVAVAFAYARYGEIDFMLQFILVAAPNLPADYGYGLPVIYAVWIGVVVLLYPACRWFAAVKGRSQSGWLSYL